MPVRVRNAGGAPVQQLPGRRMVELFSRVEGGAEGVTLRIVEVPRLRPPARRHPHEHLETEECIYVLAGRGRAWVDGETESIRPGDAILVPPRVPHMLVSTADEPLTIACFFPTADMPASMVEHPDIELPQEILYADA